jgi:hypothetical protein
VGNTRYHKKIQVLKVSHTMWVKSEIQSPTKVFNKVVGYVPEHLRVSYKYKK